MKKFISGLVAVVFSVLLLSGISEAGRLACGSSLGPCGVGPVQGANLFNTQTTGGAATAVTVTLTAVANSRIHIYSIDARCNTAAETSNITITDGGTTIWTSGPLAVTAAAPFYRKEWPTALTGTTAAQVVITLAACATGTGTLMVQADKF